MLLSFIRKYQALLALSALSIAMLLFRIFYLVESSCNPWDIYVCPKLRFLFLVWNAILAWIPIALLEFMAESNSKIRSWGLFILAILFFPNAPYLVTDLIHLRSQAGIPLWYDALLLFSFAYLGVTLAIRALRLMQAFMFSRFASKQAWFGMALILFLSGIGIYLGRVLRWNSWDAIFEPHHLILDALALLWSPLQHLEAWLMILLYSTLLACVYWVWQQDYRLEQKSPGS